MYSFEVESELATEKALLTARCLNMKGVNQELNPFVTIVVRKKWSEMAFSKLPLNQYVCEGLILLFGFLPIDIHWFRFKAINESGFNERSTTLTNKEWNHDRTIQSCEQGSRVTDTISFKSRLPLLGLLLKPVYKSIFMHRHRRLARLYGSNL